MDLGAFSISLAVKDIEKSREFYEKLDFKVIGGDVDQYWLILRNGESTIGLFQGMFDTNTLTFNPGWSTSGSHPLAFDDVRDIQRTFKERGIEIAQEADESGTGVGHMFFFDPDGNPILIDQHVPRPGDPKE